MTIEDQVKSLVAEWGIKTSALRNVIAQQDDDIARLSGQLIEAKNKNESLRDAAAWADERSTKLTKENRELRDRLTQVSKERLDGHTKIAVLREQNGRLTAELDDARTHRAEYVTKLEGEVTCLRLKTALMAKGHEPPQPKPLVNTVKVDRTGKPTRRVTLNGMELHGVWVVDADSLNSFVTIVLDAELEIAK